MVRIILHRRAVKKQHKETVKGKTERQKEKEQFLTAEYAMYSIEIGLVLFFELLHERIPYICVFYKCL